jgi:hypothetical protein
MPKPSYQFETREEIQKLISGCDHLIKTGNLTKAAGLLTSIHPAKILRAQRLPVARLCRRVGVIRTGIRILQPIIRGSSLDVEATPLEKCEYASLLSRNGSLSEALDLLEGIDDPGQSEVILLKAWCHVLQWEYREAAPLFSKYLNSVTDPYSRLIGMVNLVASRIALGEYDAAKEMLTEATEQALASTSNRLLGNCIELRCQVNVLQNDLAQAKRDIKLGLELTGNGNSYDRLLLLKWKAVVESAEQNDPAPLKSFRNFAVQQRHWESVRESDLFLLKLQFDPQRLNHLVHGTPSTAYRERVLRHISDKPSDVYRYGSSEGPLFDFQNGPEGSERWTEQALAVIAALTKDLYVPANMGTLFRHLYPGEYFDINTSHLRVRQAIRRTREITAASEIPLEIIFNSNAYELKLGKIGIELGRSAKPSCWLESLKGEFGESESFSVSEACKSLKISKTHFLQLVRGAIDEKKVVRLGKGKATRYRVA